MALRMQTPTAECLPTSSSELIGPFITVVSVDGGLQCGNKLTVITPTEISDSSKLGQEAPHAVYNAVDSSKTNGQSTAITNTVQESTLCQSMVVATGKELENDNENETCKTGATYVTVLALGKENNKGGEQRENLAAKKSIVNISNAFAPMQKKTDDVGETQIVTISNKALVTGKKSLPGKNSSIVKISKSDEESDSDGDIDIQPAIEEHVIVYRLPGERLGFGLRFDGGVTNPKENVKHLFIQSCADNSPAIRAQTSWGHLVEGDEVLTIESTAVSTMTRMDCVQCLKDASVAVRLYVRHIYTTEEMSFLQAQRKLALEKRQLRRVKSQGAFPCQMSENSKVTSGPSSSKGENSLSVNKEEIHSEIENSTAESNSLAEQEINTAAHQSKLNRNGSDEEGGKDSATTVGMTSAKGQEQATLMNEGEDLVKLKLQPPVAFADEYDSNNNADGHTSPVCPPTHNRISSLNDGLLGPDPPQIYMNAIDPTVMMMLMHGSASGNMQGSPNTPNLNMSHLNLSLTGSSSSLSICESDETGSTRSTVVSRLSMASSMTSISAIAITADNPNSSGNLTTMTNNGVIVTHSNTNNNVNANVNGTDSPAQHTNAVCVSATKRKSSLTCPEQDSFQQQHQNHLGLVVNNVRTIPCSADAEIPLEPPLSFQDQETMLLAMANAASAQNDDGHVNVNGEEVSRATATKSNTSPEVLTNNLKEKKSVQPPMNHNNQVGHENSAAPTMSRIPITKEDRWKHSFRTTQHENDNVLNNNSDDRNNVDEASVATETLNAENNSDDDEDELALLADELGLEQLDEEDEELFAALAAEADKENSNTKSDNDRDIKGVSSNPNHNDSINIHVNSRHQKTNTNNELILSTQTDKLINGNGSTLNDNKSKDTRSRNTLIPRWVSKKKDDVGPKPCEMIKPNAHATDPAAVLVGDERRQRESGVESVVDVGRGDKKTLGVESRQGNETVGSDEWLEENSAKTNESNAAHHVNMRKVSSDNKELIDGRTNGSKSAKSQSQNKNIRSDFNKQQELSETPKQSRQSKIPLFDAKAQEGNSLSSALQETTVFHSECKNNEEPCVTATTTLSPKATGKVIEPISKEMEMNTQPNQHNQSRQMQIPSEVSCKGSENFTRVCSSDSNKESQEKVKATDDGKLSMNTNKPMSKDEHSIANASHYNGEEDKDDSCPAGDANSTSKTTSTETSDASLQNNDDDSIKIKVESMQLEQKHVFNENTTESNNNMLVTTFSGTLNPCPAQCPTPPPRAKGGERRKSIVEPRRPQSTGEDKWQLCSSDGNTDGKEQVVVVGEGAVVRLQVEAAISTPTPPIVPVDVTREESCTDSSGRGGGQADEKVEEWDDVKTDSLNQQGVAQERNSSRQRNSEETNEYVQSGTEKLDGAEEKCCSDSDKCLLEGTTLNGSSLEARAPAPDSLPQENEPPSNMDSTAELLHFIPPTFSRLPPDGDEFPNSWSDEQTLKTKYDNKKLFRSEFNIKDIKISTKIGSPPPPPLPISEPPREDLDMSLPPPLPASVPPLPPKTHLARRSSVEDRKKLFEAQQGKVGSGNSNSGSSNLSSTNSFTTQKVTSAKTQEPSKKSVRDKIAMFSSRSSSTEDSGDTVFTKPLTTTSSLPRSNGITSRSSENLLSGVGMSLANGNSTAVNTNGIGSMSKINRSSMDLQTSASSTLPTRKNSMDVNRMMNKTNAFYETLHSTAPPAKNLHERSQSMIDVGGGTENSYQNQSVSSYRYGNATGGSRPLSTSSMMEQRRKCMTKLRGLVIPDVPKSADQAIAPNLKANSASMSVVDLPTIISKDAVIPPQFSSGKPPLSTSHIRHQQQIVSRTDSLEGISGQEENNPNSTFNRLLNGRNTNSNNNSAKGGSNNNTNSSLIVSQIEADFTDWKFPNALPKYSPAFKRRSLTPYQSALTSPTLKTKTIAPTITSSIPSNNYNSKPLNTNTSTNATPTPEPKSLESLTSPRSDSSFEFSSPSPPAENGKISKPARKSSFDKQQLPQNNPNEETKEKPTNQPVANGVNGKYNGKGGKLEDSDNDSAVSSSRSSISHGLSPRNSPTPEESSSTPDPDHDQQMNDDNGRNREMHEGEGDDSANSDEGWRVLKPTSVEAINRKNVLTSAKFSSGGGRGNDDGHSSASSNGKNRRSDEEEAGYADAEAEDTESSCSELEVSKSHPRRQHMIVAGRINIGGRRNSKADTEEEDVYVDVDVDEEIERQSPPSHSQQSSVDLGDLILPDLTESPLQAIFDMEVKMAYINEICDALPGSGRSDSLSSNSRYFSRRDSEATVIERPIEPSRKLSVDQLDSADRRARNRSSSGNESDFSSSISVGSQNQISAVANKPEDRWSLLEKKYSKSMTAVNLLAQKPEPPPPTLTPAVSVPKIVTCASEVVEKKIERIIEKSSTEALNKKSVGSKVIPRGRNDFKSLAEKWQQMSADGKPLPPSKSNAVPEKLNLSPQNSSSGTTVGLRTRLTSPPPALLPKNLLTKTNSADLLLESSNNRHQQRPIISPKPVSIVASETIVKTHIADDNDMIDPAREADIAWAAEKRRSDVTANNNGSRLSTEPMLPMNSTKRSVSVNDIRKAFEKAEIAVNAYGRDDNGATNKKETSGLSLPSAHFRVSSFDSTTSEDSSATTPAGIYGSVNSLVSSAPRDPYGSITSLASSTSLISPQELQQLIDEANQSLEEAGTPSHEVSVVILHREFAGGSLGITLAGGADYETKEITVHKVLTGSIADRDARVHRGDRILSINGKSTKGLTHRDALNLLKAPRTEVVLVVSRGRTASNGFQTIEETSATLDRAVEPLLNATIAGLLDQDEDSTYKWGPLRTVILVKDGAGLGFSLEGGKGSIHGDKPLTVKKIFIGGPAEKSGDLKVGDLITSINNVNVSSKSRTEAWNFMKKIGDGEVKINVRSPI